MWRWLQSAAVAGGCSTRWCRSRGSGGSQSRRPWLRRVAVYCMLLRSCACRSKLQWTAKADVVAVASIERLVAISVGNSKCRISYMQLEKQPKKQPEDSCSNQAVKRLPLAIQHHVDVSAVVYTLTSQISQAADKSDQGTCSLLQVFAKRPRALSRVASLLAAFPFIFFLTVPGDPSNFKVAELFRRIVRLSLLLADRSEEGSFGGRIINDQP